MTAFTIEVCEAAKDLPRPGEYVVAGFLGTDEWCVAEYLEGKWYDGDNVRADFSHWFRPPSNNDMEKGRIEFDDPNFRELPRRKHSKIDNFPFPRIDCPYPGKQNSRDALEQAARVFLCSDAFRDITTVKSYVDFAEKQIAVALAPWTPINSVDQLPDGHLWLTWKGGNVDDSIVRRSNYTDEGFADVYSNVIAYCPFVTPEPYVEANSA